jgi:hypothetical protein
MKARYWAMTLLACFVVGFAARRWSSRAAAVESPSDGAPGLDHPEAVRPPAPEIVSAFDPPMLNGPEEKGLAEARGFFPRPASEWQGMLVRLEDMPVCEDHCLSPFACVDGRCAPCTKDGDCESGELCVLDHCLLQQNADCQSRADCADEQFCVLSGYPLPVEHVFPNPKTYRGNEGMRSYCQDLRGGTEAVAPLDQKPAQAGDPTRIEDPLRTLLQALLEIGHESAAGY